MLLLDEQPRVSFQGQLCVLQEPRAPHCSWARLCRSTCTPTHAAGTPLVPFGAPQKRRSRPPSRVRLYRVAPHTPDSPLYLVPRAVAPPAGSAHPDWRCLDPRCGCAPWQSAGASKALLLRAHMPPAQRRRDPLCRAGPNAIARRASPCARRGCFIIHLPGKLYVWRGTDCLSTMLEGGLRCASQLGTYEGAATPQVVHQGERGRWWPDSEAVGGWSGAARRGRPWLRRATVCGGLPGAPQRSRAAAGSWPSRCKSHHLRVFPLCTMLQPARRS